MHAPTHIHTINPGTARWERFPGDSLKAQTGKSQPAMQETRVRSLGWEDPLEKEMATHSGILAWKIPRMVEPGRVAKSPT